jgi:hypothetical protein
MEGRGHDLVIGRGTVLQGDKFTGQNILGSWPV